MFKPHMGICTCHNQKRLIVVKSGLCKIGNDEKKRKSKGENLLEGSTGTVKMQKQSRLLRGKIRSSKNRNGRPSFKINKLPKKTTGQLNLFQKLYEERGPYSQISGQYVNFHPACFSHILSKQAYKSLELEPENIVIKTIEEHNLWHNNYDRLKFLPEWQWVLDLEQKLKQKYYQQNKITKK